MERLGYDEALYDLVFDPGEHNNLAASDLQREALAEMRARLDAWMKRTADPILKGPILLPKGAVTTGVDAITYKDRGASIYGI